jgi:LacI family transcriptional regulator
VPTVSQILNNKGHRYRDQTCKKVMKAVRELGYRPNSYARAVRLGKFNCIALVLSTEKYKSFLPGELLRGVHEGVAGADMHLTLTMLPDDKLTNQGFVPKILQQWMADGLLINYHVHVPAMMMELIRKNGIPSIWINTKFEHDCVYPDDFSASQKGTEKLLQLGHRNIAFADFGFPFGRIPEHYSGVDRFEGYAAAMRAAGLSPMEIRGQEYVPLSERLAAARAALSKPDRPTAVVTYSDTSALPVLHAATSLGIRVPQDLSILTFGEQLVDIGGVGITTMLIPWAAVGQSGSQMLLEKIANPAQVLKSRALEFEVAEGVTCSAKTES